MKRNQQGDGQLFLVHFRREWHSGLASFTQNRKVSGKSPTDAFGQTLGPTSLRGSPWPSRRTWNDVVINIGWVRLPPCHWTKVGLRSAKWLIKKSLNKLYIYCFVVLIAVFDKQAYIHCSISSISRPISSLDLNATNQAIAMDIYQSYFRKLNNFFS